MLKVGTHYSTDLSSCNSWQLLVLEIKVMLSFYVWVCGLDFFPLFLAPCFSWDNAEAEFCPSLCIEQSCWSCSRLTQSRTEDKLILFARVLHKYKACSYSGFSFQIKEFVWFWLNLVKFCKFGFSLINGVVNRVHLPPSPLHTECWKTEWFFYEAIITVKDLLERHL